MKQRIEACALNKLLACALLPVAVPNGKSFGLLRPSRPIGIRARTMTPSASRSACRPSIAGCARIHHAEGVAVDLQLTGVQPRPSRDADMRQPLLEPDVAPFAVNGVDAL